MDNVFLEDVMKQHEAMEEAIKKYRGYAEVFQKIAALKPDRVLFTGMGSSHFAAIPASIRLNQGGIVSNVYSASELLYYEWNLISSDTLLVLTSQSGESGEIVDILQKLPADRLVIGITNEPQSTLGRRADILLSMGVEPEVAVSSRTYLASLVLLNTFAALLLGESARDTLDRCQNAIEVLAAFLRDYAPVQKKAAEFLEHPSAVCYIGRGPAVGTAEASALFTREAAKYPALAFDSAEFRHGPYEMVDNRFRAIVFAPTGATFSLQVNLAGDIARHGGKILFVTNENVTFQSDHVLVIKHGDVPETYAPIVQILVAQLFANDMSLYQGYKPWVFRQSGKVTTIQ